MKNIFFEEKRTFILKLGKALHKYGTPAYRLESHLINLAEYLDLRAQFLIAPTNLTFVIQSEDESKESSQIMRVKPGEINLSALASTDELVHELVDGGIDLIQAGQRLDAIISQKPLYSRFTTFCAFGLTSAAFAILLLSSWNDVLCATLLGFVVYGLTYLAGKSARIANMLEPMAALTSGFLATLVTTLDVGINVSFVTLSAIILFIPGLSLTLGLAEVAERDLISGTARVMDSCMSLFKLYFGAQLGMVLGNLVVPHVQLVAPPELSSDFVWLGVPMLSLGLVVAFNTRPKDIVWGLGAGLLAYFFTLIGNNTLGADLAPFVGALAVGIFANLYSNILKTPASIVLLQGIVVLVPGSKTYINLSSQVSGDAIIMNPTLASQTFLIFMAIVAGITFANLIVPPKRSL